MTNKYQTLRDQLTPSQLAESEVMAREMISDMLLSELRKFAGLTQEELAEAMGIKQPTLSKLENQDDMQISTLQRLVQALGGELELVVRFPNGDIRIRQFKQAS